MPRSVCFRGSKELQKAEVQRLLGLNPGMKPGMNPGGRPGSNPSHVAGSSPRGVPVSGIGRYLLPVGENDFTLETAIEELQARAVPL